jgi:hypothetical protein
MAGNLNRLWRVIWIECGGKFEYHRIGQEIGIEYGGKLG